MRSLDKLENNINYLMAINEDNFSKLKLVRTIIRFKLDSLKKFRVVYKENSEKQLIDEHIQMLNQLLEILDLYKEH